MKILFFIPALNSGGSERVIVTLANHWSQVHQVSILTFQDTPCFYQLDPKVKHIKMGFKLPRTGIKRLLSIPFVEWKRLRYFVNFVRGEKFDFIIAFTGSTNMLSMLAKWLYNLEPVFISERADPMTFSWFVRQFRLWLYRKADGIICQNVYVQNYYATNRCRMPLPILPNPVNFDDIPSQTSPKRREIVAVGRLAPEKNHALLINAFSEIASKYPQYTLKIYGVGPLEHSLKKQIAELGLTDRVFLMGSKKRVMFEVQQSDIFVLSSNFEGFPNVLIEAMASGMPVISSDFPTGVARQLIKEGENGYLFAVGDKATLVSALEKMLSCPDKWPQMGEKNRQIAKQYTAEEVASNWMATILHIISGRNK